MRHPSRILAVAGLALATGLGYVVAAASTARADLVPALPVTVPLPPTPVEVLPRPTVEVPALPSVPTETTGDGPPAGGGSGSSSGGGSGGGSTPAGNTVAARSVAPTSSGRAAVGVRRLADGRISIPVSSVVLPDRLVITGVTVTPTRLTTRSALLRTRVQVRNLRGYLVRDALVDVRRAGIQPVTLGNVFRTKLDGRVAPALRLGALRLIVGKSLVLVVRAYKTRGFPVGGVATQRRVVVPVVRPR